MPQTFELPPIPDERLHATAEWMANNVHPAAQLVETEAEGMVSLQSQPFEIRPHQIEVLARLWQAREQGKEQALGHLATGGGKTTVAAIDALKYRQEAAQMDPPLQPRYLYVSHKHEINHQAAATFQRFMPDLDIHFFDSQKAHKRPEADLTFATIQSLFSKLDTFDPDDFEYIFWDEGHHLKAETFEAVVEHFRPLFEIAATATVDRMDGQDIREYFGEAVFSKGLVDGIAEGWLADISYHIVFDKAIKDTIKGGFEPTSLKEIKRLFEKKASPKAIAKSIEAKIEELGLDNPKMMIFCESVKEADEMAQLLGGASYHSDTKDKKNVLQAFKSGANKVITTKDMFNEGVDVPDAELVIFLRATQSGPLFEQQLGRGLRKAAGKERVYVLDFVANIERIVKIRELSEAIQERASQLGDDDLFEERETNGDNGGLRVHSRHGDFDFDSIAIDLLSKLDALQSNADKWTTTRSYDNTEILALAHRISPDKPLTKDRIEELSKNGDFPSTKALRDRFGSISAFQRECGFEVEHIERSYTPEMSNDQLIEWALEISPDGPLGYNQIRDLSKAGGFPSTYTIKKRFGSIPNFQEECGFEVIDPRTRKR